MDESTTQSELVDDSTTEDNNVKTSSTVQETMSTASKVETTTSSEKTMTTAESTESNALESSTKRRQTSTVATTVSSSTPKVDVITLTDDQNATLVPANNGTSSEESDFLFLDTKTWGLVAATSLGVIFMCVAVVLLSKRCYDGYQRRHYSKIDYLVNGMYN